MIRIIAFNYEYDDNTQHRAEPQNEVAVQIAISILHANNNMNRWLSGVGGG